ncbi:isochorismatase family protein [Patescibacteria group bacterium]|nr:isochorismatase family protein [Patescibacteria group bacterium]
MNIRVNGKEYLIEQVASFDVDPQNGFTPLCPEELPVPEGDKIVPELNAQAKFAGVRVASRDAHSTNAEWVATTERPQFTPIVGKPNLDLHWNLHCKFGTFGFEFISGLPSALEYNFVATKGMEVDSHPYGGCYQDLCKSISTGVIEFLKAKGVQVVIVGGLATDYCLLETVLELIAAGFVVVVNLGACRGVAPESTKKAVEKMRQVGVLFIESAQELASAV